MRHLGSRTLGPSRRMSHPVMDIWNLFGCKSMIIGCEQVEAVSARGLRGVSRNTHPRVKRAMEELQEMDATHSKMGFAMQRESDVIASVATVDALDRHALCLNEQLISPLSPTPPSLCKLHARWQSEMNVLTESLGCLR